MKQQMVNGPLLFLSMVGAICSLPHHVEAQIAPSHPILDPLNGFYGKAESVHMRAALDISVRLPLFEGHAVPVSGHGVIEHWEKEGKFRTKVWVDPRLGLTDNVDIAYDGINYQISWPDTGLLATEDPQYLGNGLLAVPGAVPNPFYLPVAHLAPGDDDCPGCQPTLGFMQDADNWAEKLSALKTSGVADPVFDLLGGSRAGEAYTFRVGLSATESVDMGRSEGDRNIHRIDRLRPDGETISTIVLSEWMEVLADSLAGNNLLRFPKEIRLDGYDPDQPEGNHLVTRVDYVIEHLEVDSYFDDEIFKIDGKSAVAVWERGQRIRQHDPGPEVSPDRE